MFIFARSIHISYQRSISTDYAHNRNKPLPTIKEWKVIKDAYLRYVDENQVFVESDKPDNGYNFDINEELCYAATGKNGRGLFSTRDISKGELLHNGQKTDLIFPNAKGFRQLVFNLPRDRACDVIGRCSLILLGIDMSYFLKTK